MPSSARPLRYLRIVDDDASHRWLIKEAVEADSSLDLTVLEHADLDAFCASVEADPQAASVVLLDNRIGALCGVDVLPDVIRQGGGPVILLTGHGDEEVAASAMRAGASDYLVKSRIFSDADILHRSIRGAIERFELERQNAGYQEELVAKNRRLAQLYELSHTFVDNVSHEFRTPLAVLKEFNSLLLDGLAGDLSELQREYVQIMAAKVEDLIIMVNDLLDASRIESGMVGVARMPCAVADIIDSVCVTLDARVGSGKVELRIDVPDGLPDVYCDPEKIGRALINLVVNAIKFSPENGVVRVVVPEPRLHSEDIEFRVTDCGPGIPPEKVDAIFERFRQVGDCNSATKGFGLGLNIVRELARLNMASVGVSSVLGSGSTFTLAVPVYEPRLILQRYLEHRTQLGSESHGVTLISVRISHEEATRRAETADFLNHSLRPHDLLLPGREEGQYYIVAAVDEGHAIIRRLQEAFETVYQGMPSGRIPAIDLEGLGTWTVNTRADEPAVVRQLESIILGSEVPAHV